MPTNGNHIGQVIAAANDAVDIKRHITGNKTTIPTVPTKPLKT
jgi:hypothetical protein